MRGENLDGDDALQPRIQCTIHLAHAASSERRLNFIRSESGARGKGHPCASLYSCAAPWRGSDDSGCVVGQPEVIQKRAWGRSMRFPRSRLLARVTKIRAMTSG